MDWYTQSFVACAPWSYVLMFGQTMLLAMLIERAAFLTLKAQLNVGAFMTQIRKLVLAGNADRAQKLANAAGDVPIARVCKAGLEALDGGPFELEQAMTRAVAEERPKLRRRLPQVFLISGGLAVVGIAGSFMLGARGIEMGGSGPLPLGLAMVDAPLLIGGVSAIVGMVGGFLLSIQSNKIAFGLEQCKQLMLKLGAERQPSY